MFNGVVNPFIGTATSSQHHLFDHVLPSFPPPNDHYHQLLHATANRYSSCFYDYEDPFDQNTFTGRSLFVQSSSSKKDFSSSIEAVKPSLDNDSDGHVIIIDNNNNNSSALQRERRSDADDDNDCNNIHDDPYWCSDEVIAPLKARSRKLAELGYKRGSNMWKKKYEGEEEENKKFNPIDHLEEPGIKENEELREEQLLQKHKSNDSMEETPNNDAEAKLEVISEEVVIKGYSSNKKKKRRREEEDTKFETLKHFFEAAVNKMMAHQEELHKKLIEDITRRDEESIAREEAWRNQEMAKMREETEMRAHELLRAEKRQAMVIEFLKKFTSSYDDGDDDNGDQFSAPQDKVVAEENPNSLPTKTASGEDSRTSSLEKSSESEAPQNQEKGSGEIGKKRWPRDEVLALINLRCKMSNNKSDSIAAAGGGKGHLWERISRGMLVMGYERSAKRCKEKWENINKYFRRTRDSNKKRSMGSRTCPYFHQLSCLYSEEETLLTPSTKKY